MEKYGDLLSLRNSQAEECLSSRFDADSFSFEKFEVLLVDDESAVLKSLKRVFMDEPCRINTANSAEEALDIIDRQAVHLVVSDYRMPGMSGAELLQNVKQRNPDILRIMLTGHADIGAIMSVVEEVGVFKFIAKPWQDDDLRLTVKLAFKQYLLTQENFKLRELNKRRRLKLKNLSRLFHDNHESQANVLKKAGCIDEQQLKEVYEKRGNGESLLAALTRLEVLSEDQVSQAFQEQLKLAAADLKNQPPQPELYDFLPAELCLKGQLVPLRFDRSELCVAMVDPSDMIVRDHIQLMTGLKVVPQVTTVSEIEAWAAKLLSGEDENKSRSDAGLGSGPRTSFNPQLLIGLSAVRQGLEALEEVLEAGQEGQGVCPLCQRAFDDAEHNDEAS